LVPDGVLRQPPLPAPGARAGPQARRRSDSDPDRSPRRRGAARLRALSRADPGTSVRAAMGHDLARPGAGPARRRDGEEPQADALSAPSTDPPRAGAGPPLLRGRGVP